jgi:hypothetical protein
MCRVFTHGFTQQSNLFVVVVFILLNLQFIDCGLLEQFLDEAGTLLGGAFDVRSRHHKGA